METTNFPESSGSSKLGGTSSNGAGTSMGMDPVADMPGGGSPMTGNEASGMSAASRQSSAPSSSQPAAERFTSAAHKAIDKVADFASRYSGSPNQAMEASKNLVQDKPMVAIGAALAFGLLLGRLTSR